MRVFFIFLCCTLLATGQQHQATPSPIQRCINLGNMLEAPAEGEWGLRVKPDYLSLIANAGFDTIRVPISWSTHTTDVPPYIVSPEFFARIDEVIQWAFENDLQVILNIHHYNEIMIEPEAHFPRLLAIWTQIAEHYAAYPETLMFELLNEPNENLTSELWNTLIPEIIATVRQTHPERLLIIGGGEWNSLNGLLQLNLPDDPYLMATFHYYEPFNFTHQGAEWVEGMDEVQDVSWGTDGEYSQVSEDMQSAAEWGAEQGIPVLMGEFGAYSKADMESRVKWTRAVREASESAGTGWCYWEFASGFGIYDPDNETFRQELYEALIP